MNNGNDIRFRPSDRSVSLHGMSSRHSRSVGAVPLRPVAQTTPYEKFRLGNVKSLQAQWRTLYRNETFVDQPKHLS